MDKQSIIDLGRDLIYDRVSLVDGKFSDSNLNEAAFRDALNEITGENIVFNHKTFRDHPELYTIVEALVPDMIQEGLKGDEFFMNLVEYRNAANGDSFKFKTKKKTHYIVADASYGSGGIRRQRLQANESITVDTTLKTIQLYDDIERFKANKITLSELVEAVSKAYKERILEDIYATFKGITSTTAGLSSTYVRTGVYKEDDVMELVAHVEAATGMKAYIMGTKVALRKLAPSIVADQAKTDLYNIGYYGKFNGTDCYSFNQVHKVGTEEFLFDDDTIYVFGANGDKPIKFCDIGEGTLYIDNSNTNADRSTNISYDQESGVASIFASVIGIWKFA